MSLKDCLWDYDLSKKEVEKIFSGDDFRKKEWLFARIVYHSQDKIGDLLKFSGDDLKILFDTFKFEARFGLSEDNFYALRNTMLNERTFIKKYQWKKF